MKRSTALLFSFGVLAAPFVAHATSDVPVEVESEAVPEPVETEETGQVAAALPGLLGNVSQEELQGLLQTLEAEGGAVNMLQNLFSGAEGENLTRMLGSGLLGGQMDDELVEKLLAAMRDPLVLEAALDAMKNMAGSGGGLAGPQLAELAEALRQSSAVAEEGSASEAETAEEVQQE